MSGEDHREAGSGRGKFTLFKFTLALVLVGVAVSFAVPYVRIVMERSRVAEAVYYLSAVRAAQESYRKDAGIYADSLAKLRLGLEPPGTFSVSGMSVGDTGDFGSSWRLRLTRVGLTSFGEYTVVFTDAGFDAQRSSIDEEPPLGSILANGAKSDARPGKLRLGKSLPVEGAAASESSGEATGPPPHCESTNSPSCDGHCPQGHACVIEKDSCRCVPTLKPCGGLGAPPLCYGLCPTGEVCRDSGGVCECGR